MKEQNQTHTKTEERQHIKTILFVDDDENWFFIGNMLLQKIGVGQQTYTATNGLNALRKLQTMAANGEAMPDLIFLDIKMPVMDGFEFMDEVAKSEELDLSRSKIYFCSSSLNSKDKERASLYPVAGFITKPLTKEILLDVLA